MQGNRDFFETLSNQLAIGLPFVAYRVPATNGTVKALLQSNSNVYKTADFSESGFVFAPFDDLGNSILLPSSSCKEISFHKATWEKVETEKIAPPISRASEEKERHIQLVRKGRDKIREGELKKVVLSRREAVPLHNPDAIEIFKRLLHRYATAFVYVWFHPEIGLWLGATPETLLQVERNRFKTMALAGTQKFTDSMDVVWGEKEQEEQQFVTDSIVDDLKNLGYSLNTTEPYTTKAGNLLHLRTDITGGFNIQLPTSDTMLQQIISALHPTPAICGLPKDLAKQFILENENYNREYYTGFLGELNMKKNIVRSSNKRNTENLAYGSMLTQTSLFVNLRCMKLEDNRALLFVGGGITKDSEPGAEWEETLNKAETMKAVLLN